MAVLERINKDLTEAGEFVATQGLVEPRNAKVARGEKKGPPAADDIFPESKEFLLGYWIVDVGDAECASRRMVCRLRGGRRSQRASQLKGDSSDFCGTLLRDTHRENTTFLFVRLDQGAAAWVRAGRSVQIDKRLKRLC